MGADIGRRDEGGQYPSQNPKTISFSKKNYRSSVDVINAVIKELRRAQIDIQKVSFFEEPLEAIVQIKKDVPTKPKFSWFKIFGNPHKNQIPLTFLKLSVRQSSNKTTPFQLRYEIVSTGI